MNAPEFLELSATQTIAYHRIVGHGDGANKPGIIFLGGFRSDMTGTKAIWLQKWAERHGRSFVRFDYRGHGASSANFLDGCIGDWAQDAAGVLAHLTTGPQILIGSSMGGWISLLMAKNHPDRVAGLIGIAAAPDFTEDSIKPALSESQRYDLDRKGYFEVPSEYSDDPYPISKRLLDDGAEHLVLRTPLRLEIPVRLLHGTADVDVKPSVALRLLDHIDSPDVRLNLVKNADHRFSDDRCLSILEQTLDEISGGV